MAASCAAVFHSRVYNEFDRVRVRVVTTPQVAVDGTIDVPLPAVDGLVQGPTAIILRLHNIGREQRAVDLVFGDVELERVLIGPGETRRVDRSISSWRGVNPSGGVRLTGDGDEWALQYLELANIHGFSTGLFSLVITPAEARSSSRSSGITSTSLLFLALLAISSWCFRTNEDRTTRLVFRLVGLTVLCALYVALVLPALSPYRLLLSTQAFSLCVFLLYGSSLCAYGLALARSLIPPFWTLVGWLRRRCLAPVLGFGHGLVRWPSNGLSYLVSHVKQRRMWLIERCAGGVDLVASGRDRVSCSSCSKMSFAAADTAGHSSECKIRCGDQPRVSCFSATKLAGHSASSLDRSACSATCLPRDSRRTSRFSLRT